MSVVRRIAAMSPDEIRTRAGMALRQRLDAWQASLGGNPLDPGITSHPQSDASRFFFEPAETTALASGIRTLLPVDVAGIVVAAADIQRGSFDLLGYRGLSFGTGKIDWHLDPVHGTRAPSLPWHRVPYLDFRRTGDHKITWELSRHQNLMILARAWLFSGDGRYLRILEALWRDWRASNPYPLGINWASALEVAFRCLSWIWVDHLTAGSAEMRDVRDAMRKGIGESAVYIERYLSTYFAPNTHLLGEALALFFTGVLYPEFERAGIWRDHGWKIILQESRRQVHPDGFHFEQSVYYHVYALDMFLHARILAARNGIPIPAAFDEVLFKMCEGLAAIGAGGQAPRFGDDDGGRLFDGRRNRTEHLLDPLATASIIYRRGDWKCAAAGLREETIWLLGLDGIRAFRNLSGGEASPRSRAFPSSGYYILAAGSAMAILDAGPHGWGRGGHGHADALSLQLIAGGRAWLTDPGTCSYPMEKPDRDRFRGTAAHNTMEVDGVSQAEPFHSFGWRSHPVTSVHRWHEGRKITIFHGSHDGYARLSSPVIHHRRVIAWSDEIWLVRDVASGEGAHRLDVRWLLSEECKHVSDDPWRFAAGPDTLTIHTAGSGWTARREMSQSSPAYGAVADVPLLRFSYEGVIPSECGTLIVRNREARFRHGIGKGISVYVYWSDVFLRLIVFATESGWFSFEGLESDAEVAGIEISGGALSHAFRVGGSGVCLMGVTLDMSQTDGSGVWESMPTGAASSAPDKDAVASLLAAVHRWADQ